ncbi:MAG: HU family DNA-binding protein [Acetobacteraceae bacterium]|nr:HU family DNA-binding protein [Acetobacteraceae bacterium]
MNKMELITAVADDVDLPRAKAAEVVEAVLAVIGHALKQDNEVRLVGFGTFATAKRKPGTGRNPRTGEEIAIPGSVSVKFKPGKLLKESLN